MTIIGVNNQERGSGLRPIRNAARAVIIEDSKVLLTKNIDFLGEFYMFPGGGQNKGEPLSSTVYRECMEEVGMKVIPGDIVCIREYIGSNHEFAELDNDLHQVEFYFLCSIDSGEQEGTPLNPDADQIGVEWVDFSLLKDIRIYPQALAHILFDKGMDGLTRIYFGDVN